MASKFYKIFKRKKVIIGMIHFPPLLGYVNGPGLSTALDNALKDLQALTNGGVDGIMIENNYDTPHKISVGPETVAAMTFLGAKIRLATNLPMGINVLWNDYHASLSIAKVLDLQFIRIPVFVDKVKTDCGIVDARPQEVIDFQKNIGAANIAILTDIHVKHAKLLSKYGLAESAKLAVKGGSDAIIVTGEWTGQAPEINDLMSARKSVGDFPILVGSGADKENITELLSYADGVIVSTSLKEGKAKKGEVNVRGWEQRVTKDKVAEFVARAKQNRQLR